MNLKYSVKMRRLSVLIFVIWIAAALWNEAARAEIRVIQGKDGKITLTDENTSFARRKGKRTPSYKNTVAGITYVSEISPNTIPAKYIAKIKTLSIKYKLNESLITAVARAESGFNPFAVSHKGAVGIMQLMAETAMIYGVFNRYNADENLEAGVKHLKYLYERYNHDVPLALAAYNAGEEAVKKYKGIPPYKETRTYIKRVMNYMGMSYSITDTALTAKTRIYQYRTAEGKMVITDTFPAGFKGEIIVID
jgi:soluble lytic murein transglycosylase-like protein